MIELREGFTGAPWTSTRHRMLDTWSSAMHAHIDGAPLALAPLFAENSRAHAWRGKQGNWHAGKINR